MLSSPRLTLLPPNNCDNPNCQVLETSGLGFKLLRDTIMSYQNMANKPSTDSAQLQASVRVCRCHNLLASEGAWRCVLVAYSSYALHPASPKMFVPDPLAVLMRLQTWVKQQSRAANLDLSSYFKGWGWPVSAETEAALSDLPSWSTPPSPPPSPPSPPPSPPPPAPPVAETPPMQLSDYQALAAGVGMIQTENYYTSFQVCCCAGGLSRPWQLSFMQAFTNVGSSLVASGLKR